MIKRLTQFDIYETFNFKKLKLKKQFRNSKQNQGGIILRGSIDLKESWKKLAHEATGKLNRRKFLGYRRGSLLILGIDGKPRTEAKTWDVEIRQNVLAKS